MGIGAAEFIKERLLHHGADGSHPVTVVENASRPNQKIIYTNLQQLPDDILKGSVKGPAILLVGYSERGKNFEGQSAV